MRAAVAELQTTKKQQVRCNYDMKNSKERYLIKFEVKYVSNVSEFEARREKTLLCPTIL